MPYTQLLWASDFPHTDSTWPRSQQLLAEHTAHLKGIGAPSNHARELSQALQLTGRQSELAACSTKRP